MKLSSIFTFVLALFLSSTATFAQKEFISYLPFEYGNSEVNLESQMYLNQLLKQVDITNEVEVDVLGLKDEINTDYYNLGLAQRRSKAVVDYLKSKGLKISKSNVIEADVEDLSNTKNTKYVKVSRFQLIVSIRKPMGDKVYVSVLNKQEEVQTATVSRPIPSREGASQAGN